MAERRICLAETIADKLIEEPFLTRHQLAERLGIPYSAVCLAVRADSFKDLLRERKAGMIAAAMGEVHERAAAVTEAALEKLDLALSRSTDPEFILRTATILMDRTMPVKKEEGPSLVNINMVDPKLLAEARSRLVGPPPPGPPPPQPDLLVETFDGKD